MARDGRMSQSRLAKELQLPLEEFCNDTPLRSVDQVLRTLARWAVGWYATPKYAPLFANAAECAIVMVQKLSR